MSLTVHVNSLRWFVENQGGAEFLRSFGDPLDDDAVEAARTVAYPDAARLVGTLRAASVGAECWFTLDDEGADALEARPGPDAVSLGELSLSVGGNDDRIPGHVAVTGLTCRAPQPEAIARAAAALAEAFGPQVVWDDGLADVMVVHPGATVAEVRTRWERA
ncbi:hypothetical protein [Yinghuangia seranimata]|uniref:hypothetical protein n=1 Tax=Yinghuangia seranimata TaxID=408067 RepID=UPI00248D2697|nr:hypothetical protein [Yinghuangia seranimata]MDI2132123.1 hypothetical protein [Yinghuangia seranimata]